MDISRFFIDRPRFAAVISIFIFLVGVLAIFRLPISEYPEVAPPQIVVRAQYPGANPRVISETVATPLEEQINGVENLLYFDSSGRRRRQPDAHRHVQDRHQPRGRRDSGAEPHQPRAAAAAGHRPPDRRHDREVEPEPDDGGPPGQPRQHRTTRSTCATTAQLNVRDELLRIPGMGSVMHVRRRRLRDAHLAGPGQAGRTQHHHGRGHRRDPRAERAGGRRQRRRVAGAQGHRVPARRQHARAPHQRGGVRRHHRAHRARDRRPDPPARPRPRRALRRARTRCAACSTTRRLRRSRSSRRRARTRWRSRTPCAPRWSSSSPTSRPAWATASSTTRRASCRPRSRR